MMSTRPPKPTKHHYWSREEERWVSQFELEGRSIKFMRQRAPDFYDIEGGRDLQCTRNMTNPLGDSTMMSMNAVQARSGRPMLMSQYDRGHEWEELVSIEDTNVDYARSGQGLYSHFAQLITSQEYELRRLGIDRRASRIRLAWALHAQACSEREIASACEVSRHEIRKYLAQLDEIVHLAIDNEF